MIIPAVSIISVTISILIALILLFRKHQRLTNITFFIALLSMASVIFFDLLSFLNPDEFYKWKKLVLISEAITVPAWLFFSFSFARVNYWISIGKLSRFIIYLAPLLIIYSAATPARDFFYSPGFDMERVLFLDYTGFTFYLILLFCSIISMINIEATLRSSTGLKRWNIKFILIGAGGIIGMNIFYYSHALLYRSINMNLLPVKAGALMVSALLIGFSLLRSKVLDVEVFVSRHILYRSLSLFVVGAYLLWLGIMSEGVSYLGPGVSENIKIFLGFFGALVVITIILSERLRRKVMVFIDKNFYSQKYDYRDQWLKFTKRISFQYTSEGLLEAIAGGFQDAIGSTGASIWLKAKDGCGYRCERLSSNIGSGTDSSEGLVIFLKDSKWILDVNDDKCKDIVAANGDFIKDNKVSLIVPMFQSDELIGFIVLQKGLAGDDYNYEDYDLLKVLASQAVAAILNESLAEELIEAKEMEAMGKLSSFIMHDLKNTASMFSLITQNAEEHIDNPEFQRDAIKAISNTSGKMKKIIEKLKNLHKKTALNPEHLDLGETVGRIVKEHDYNEQVNISFEELEKVDAELDREEIIKVIDNLIINALDAIDKEGKIEVSVGREDKMAFVRVSDNGCGMAEEYIENHLFKPFQTTKKKGLGIGLFQCKTIAEAHSGSLKVERREGQGTVFTLYVPIQLDNFKKLV